MQPRWLPSRPRRQVLLLMRLPQLLVKPQARLCWIRVVAKMKLPKWLQRLPKLQVGQ
jgi:hypothetical protein